MTPEQFEQAGKKLFGHKRWKYKLARALGVDPATIWRLRKRKEIPGPYEVALRGLLQHHRAQAILEKEARKLLPRKFKLRRKTHKDGTPVSKQRKRRPKLTAEEKVRVQQLVNETNQFLDDTLPQSDKDA